MRIDLNKVKRGVVNLLSPRKKKKDFEGQKTEAKKTFDRATRKSSSSSDSRSVKLKNDPSDEYALTNKLGRETFYKGLLGILEQYPLLEDGEGGRFFSVPKGMSAKGVTREVSEFVMAEVKSTGFRFRWDGDISNAFSNIQMAEYRHKSTRVDDLLTLCDAFQNDPDFKAWKASKESRSPKVNPRERRPTSNRPQTKSASASSGTKQLAEFVREFQEICKAHDQRTDELGHTYAVGAKGQPALQEFLQSEIQRLGFSKRWTLEIQEQIIGVHSALENNKFNFGDWQKLRAAIENSSEVKQVQPASPRPPKNGASGSAKSPRRPEISLVSTTPEQERQLEYWFDMSEQTVPLAFDQALQRFVTVFKDNCVGFPDDVLCGYIIRKVGEYNKSTGENVSAKYALAAVKNYFSQSPRPSTGLGGRLSDYGSILRPTDVTPPSTGFGKSGSSMASTTKATDGSVDIVPITRLELDKYSGKVMQPFTGLQPSISGQTSPGWSNYPQQMNKQSISNYPQSVQESQGPGYYLHKEGFVVNQAAPSTNEPTLFERILKTPSEPEPIPEPKQ